MKKQIDLLVKLQEKDRELDRFRLQMREVPKRLQSLEKELVEFQEDVEANKRRIQDLKKTQREYETEIEDGIAHIRKSRGRLMSIKNNKEYQALLREIEETEKGNSDKEDKILVCLEDLDNLNKELEVKEKDLSAMQVSLESQKAVTAKELAHINEEFSTLEKSRDELVQTIDPQLFTKYEQIKSKSGGIALALVNNATCSECNIGIPPQMYNELQRQDSLKHCPNCQRIIFWKKTETST